MLDRSEVGKRGYLNEDYRLFHPKDTRALKLGYHYHEFDKLVFLLRGRTSYTIEGKRYLLRPMDVLLVSRNLIHLPVIDGSEPYDRMVLWVRREFLARYSTPEADLATCFDLTARRGFHLYRPRGEDRLRYRGYFEELEAAEKDGGFAAGVLADTCVLRLLVALNRDVLADSGRGEAGSYRFDPKMEEVTHYIRDHLAEDLTIDHLSRAFFLSRYYLMHRFKEVYGCTVHQYIRQKRLQKAADDIRRGVPVLKAAEEAGFGDYSVFLRAFREAYGRSPREWK